MSKKKSGMFGPILVLLPGDPSQETTDSREIREKSFSGFQNALSRHSETVRRSKFDRETVLECILVLSAF